MYGFSNETGQRNSIILGILTSQLLISKMVLNEPADSFDSDTTDGVSSDKPIGV